MAVADPASLAPLRIAHLVPSYLPKLGGMEVAVARLAGEMRRQGHAVEVLTQSEDPRLPHLETLDGVLVRRFPVAWRGGDFALAPGLWSHLRRHGSRYQIIHAHNYHAHPALGALVATAPLVFSPYFHGGGHTPLRRLLHVPYRTCGRTLFRRARAVICLCEAEAALVRTHFPGTTAIRMIPYGIDAHTIRAACPFPRALPVVLTTGRLVPHKGIALLVEAMAHLRGRYALRIVGDGPQRAALHAHCARSGLADPEILVGRVDEAVLHRWLRTAAVAVYLSRHESYGLSLLESLAAGRPVVATDIPAFREHLRFATTGQLRLVPPELAPEALAMAIDEAARSAPIGAESNTPAPHLLAMRDRCGNPDTCGSTPALPTWDATVEQTLALYASVLR